MKTTITRVMAAAALCLLSGTAHAAVTYTLTDSTDVNLTWQTENPITRQLVLSDLTGQTCSIDDGRKYSCSSVVVDPAAGNFWSNTTNVMITLNAKTASGSSSSGFGFAQGVLGQNGVYKHQSGMTLTVAGIQPAAAVPEPTTWALMLAGFGLTGAAMRRRRPAAVQALA